MAGSAASLPFRAGREVPASIVKFGHHPLHHGGVGAVRGLGRLGVPKYAITEDSCTPAAASRCLRRAFVWPTTGAEGAGHLVEGLLRIGRRIGRPTVLIPAGEQARAARAVRGTRRPRSGGRVPAVYDDSVPSLRRRRIGR